jgi:hypothetical protein
MSQDYVVVERKVSATAVVIVMLMVMVFVSIVIQFYYYSTVQDLARTVSDLSSSVRVLRYSTSELSRSLESYRAVNVIVELQMRSILIKTLRDMGFSESEIQAILARYGYGFNYTAVVDLERKLREKGFNDYQISVVISVLEDVGIIPKQQ